MSSHALLLLGSVLTGLAWSVAALLILSSIDRWQRLATGPDWSFASKRVTRLREQSVLYRYLGWLIQWLQQTRLALWIARRWQLERWLAMGGSELPWRADEYAAFATLSGLLTGLGAWFLLPVPESPASRLTLVVLIASVRGYFLLQRVKQHARRRLVRLKRRFPYSIDLLALMMEAGGELRESLAAVVAEQQNHPLGVELKRVLHEVEAGITLSAALQHLHERLDDPDIREVVIAVQSAERLGSPLSEILLNMANRLRLKHAQYVEKLAARAHADITFPGMVIMVACLALVTAPFVIRTVLEFDMGMFRTAN